MTPPPPPSPPPSPPASPAPPPTSADRPDDRVASGHEAPEPGEVPPEASADIEIRPLTAAHEMAAVREVFQQVWGSSVDVVPLEMLMAISHAGGYVVGAFDTSRKHHPFSTPANPSPAGSTSTGSTDADLPGEILGASVALLATHEGQPALHSHVTGILPGARSTGLGRAIKQHQRAWAAARGIDWIVWTFDPLVRRNAWFNIALLGAEAHVYLPNFYGTMTDAINAGDESDRLLVAWNTTASTTEADAPLRDGSGIDADVLIPTPESIVTLRRTDPAAVERWRSESRTALTGALDAGKRIVGFTRSGDYVVVDGADRAEKGDDHS